MDLGLDCKLRLDCHVLSANLSPRKAVVFSVDCSGRREILSVRGYKLLHVTQIVKDRSGDGPVISAQGMSAFKGNSVNSFKNLEYLLAHTWIFISTWITISKS